MRFYVGITDEDWFSYLSGGGTADEVNFWQPSGGRQFRVLQPGEPFLFKLHSPKNYLVCRLLLEKKKISIGYGLEIQNRNTFSLSRSSDCRLQIVRSLL